MCLEKKNRSNRVSQKWAVLCPVHIKRSRPLSLFFERIQAFILLFANCEYGSHQADHFLSPHQSNCCHERYSEMQCRPSESREDKVAAPCEATVCLAAPGQLRNIAGGWYSSGGQNLRVHEQPKKAPSQWPSRCSGDRMVV